MTNLGRMYDKVFQVSFPQVNVNVDTDADANADDAELQLQKPTFFN